jgi:hypothetical protein
MDLGVGVALALGIAGIAITIWQTVKGSSDALVQRRSERTTDAYLELLRIVERRGLWLHDRTSNLYYADEIREGISSRMKLEPPQRAEFAHAEALVAAFASSTVSACFSSWRAAVLEVDYEVDDLSYIYSEHMGGSEYPDASKLKLLSEVEELLRVRLRLLIRNELEAVSRSSQ